jgi:outer membrane protein OmpA-like peptidoglycan-associated protein
MIFDRFAVLSMQNFSTDLMNKMKRIASVFSLVILVATLVSCSHSKKMARQHEELLDTYQTLKKEMPEAEVTMEGERVKVVLPEAVLFSVNSAELNQGYFPILAKMCQVLNKYDATNILITGYTDISGTEALNKQLSQKRAENAEAVLVNNKIKSSRIQVWGMGSTDPIANNKTEEGRKQNRRVEFVIMYDYKGEKK